MKSLSRASIKLEQEIATETKAVVDAHRELRELMLDEIDAVSGSGGPVLKIPTDPC